ncbi:hypothetical protein SFR_4723 [Streptomyces sp. FR-008]|nr:hypothetical protein SFR_4723 [Streptomyces sp. FR-008]
MGLGRPSLLLQDAMGAQGDGPLRDRPVPGGPGAARPRSRRGCT